MPKLQHHPNERDARRTVRQLDARVRAQEGRVITSGATGSTGSGVWDVTRNGVSGNGVDDDTAALRGVLESMAAGDDLLVPSTAYVRVSEEISIPKRIRVVGGGTIYQAAPSTPLLTFGPAAAGSEVTEVTLRGPQSTEYQEQSRAVNVVGVSTGDRVLGVRIRAVRIESWTHGVYARYANETQILDSHIEGLSYAGIHCFSTSIGTARNNLIRNVIKAPGRNVCYGITLSRFQNGTITTDPWSQDWDVSGNKIYDIPEWEGIDTHAGIRINIDRNLVWNCFVGIAVVSGPDHLDQPVYGPRDCKVSNNTVVWPADDGLSRAGIQVVGAQAGTDPATGCTVSGNTVRNYGQDNGDSGVGGIVAYFTEGLSVNGNVIYRPVYAGVNLFNSNGGFSVADNTVVDAYTNDQVLPTPSLGYACHTVVRGAADSFGVVAGNSIRTSGNKAADHVNERGLVVGSGAASVIEYGPNDFRVAIPVSDGTGLRVRNSLGAPLFGVRGSTPIAKPTVTSSTTLEQVKQHLEDLGIWNYMP